jgi:molybdate transport system ATP-binding protein
MDEPLAALDQETKDEILPFLERLHDSLSLPVLYVSHDMGEVQRLADHLVLMQAGRVLAEGPLSQLQSDPALPLALRRDAAVSLDGIIESYDPHYGLATLEVDGGHFRVPMPAPTTQRHRLMIAAGDVSLARERPQATTILNVLPARILAASIAGSHEMVVVLGLGPKGAGSRILARVTRLSWDQMQLAEGAEVYAQAKSVALTRRNPAARLIVDGDEQNIAVGGS